MPPNESADRRRPLHGITLGAPPSITRPTAAKRMRVVTQRRRRRVSPTVSVNRASGSSEASHFGRLSPRHGSRTSRKAESPHDCSCVATVAKQLPDSGTVSARPQKEPGRTLTEKWGDRKMACPEGQGNRLWIFPQTQLLRNFIFLSPHFSVSSSDLSAQIEKSFWPALRRVTPSEPKPTMTSETVRYNQALVPRFSMDSQTSEPNSHSVAARAHGSCPQSKSINSDRSLSASSSA